MPKGTASQETERKELKSLEGAYVVLRRLTYGERVKVRGISARMHAQRQRLRQEGADEAEVEMTIDAEAVEFYRFSKCIVDHNIDDGKNLLNFKNRAHFVSLDPDVGQEIEAFIDEMNPIENLRDTADNGGTTDQGDGPLASGSTEPSPPEE
jgi:hypothetical protein